MRKYYTLQILLLVCFWYTTASSQTIYYSKGNATDFNDVASWGTAENGTGTVPTVISSADEFIISNGSVLALTGEAAVRRLTINSGSLTISAFKLVVERPGYKSTSLEINGGTLTVSGGTLEVGGRLRHMAGQFNQSGGSIIIDPNYSGNENRSALEGLRISSPTAPNWTGGSITILDPTVNHISSYPAIFYNSPAVTEVSVNHTLKFGNGVSADSGGYDNEGFTIDKGGNGAINFGNVEVFGPSANERFINSGLRLKGNLTVHPNAEIRPEDISVIVVGGNVDVMAGGKLHVGVHLAMPQGNVSVDNPDAQTFTIHDGAVVSYPANNPKTNIWTLHVHNTSAEGVTFTGTSPIPGQPSGSFSIFGGLNLRKGKVSGNGISSFILASEGNSIEANFQEGGFASGTTFGKWYSNTLTGPAFVAGTDGLASNFTAFPFVANDGQPRQAYIGRVSPVNALGIIAVTYNNTSGTTPVNVTDISATPNYTVSMKANDTWTVSALAGTPLAADSFNIQIVAPGLFGGTLTSPNTRLIQADNFIGTHQLGTVTPGGQRLGITAAQLIAAPFTLAVNTDDVLGTHDFNKADFAVYPNPVNDLLNVSYTSAITAVKIYNQLGQQVFERELNANEAVIDMSGFSGGIYLINITAGNESKTVKIVRR